MNYAIHRISLDVNDDSPSQITIAAKQGDSAKILIISLLEDKKNYQIAKGSTAQFIAKKSNEIWLQHDCVIDFESNKVIYTFQENTVKTSCTMECEIIISFPTVITKADGKTEVVTEKLTTSSFVIAVHDTVFSGIEGAPEQAVLIPELIDKGNAVIAATQALKDGTEKAATDANTATANAVKATEDAETATANAVKATEDANEYIEEVKAMVENGEFDGKDGVSATHSWKGTVLTVTSASGTSSADLKGEKGDKGETFATLVELQKADGVYNLTPTPEFVNGIPVYTENSVEYQKKVLKIYCGSYTTPKLKYEIVIGNGFMLPISLPNIEIQLANFEAEHRDYCLFELLDVEGTYSSFVSGTIVDTTYHLNIWYKLNEEVLCVSKSGRTDYGYGGNGTLPIEINSMKLSDVSKAYFFNDNNIEATGGAKVVSTVLKGKDGNGGYIYLQTFDDGSTTTFTIPKLDNAVLGDIENSLDEIIEIQNQLIEGNIGNVIYELTDTDKGDIAGIVLEQIPTNDIVNDVLAQLPTYDGAVEVEDGGENV